MGHRMLCNANKWSGNVPQKRMKKNKGNDAPRCWLSLALLILSGDRQIGNSKIKYFPKRY